MNSSPRPKSIALMFLVGAFLAGSVVSYAAVRFSNPTGRAFTQKGMRDELEQKLGLTPSQSATMDSAYDWRQAKFDSIMAPHKAAMDSIREQTRTRVLLVLDSSQKASYQQMIADQNQRNTTGSRRTATSR
ncbi:MAG: hypothetical protein ABI852_10525 [Gemmatimonadaceae bacterium]